MRRIHQRGCLYSAAHLARHAVWLGKNKHQAQEAEAAGYHAGPDQFALRRRVTVAPTSDQARVYAEAVTARLKSFVAEDERLNANVPDAPAPSGGPSIAYRVRRE